MQSMNVEFKTVVCVLSENSLSADCDCHRCKGSSDKIDFVWDFPVSRSLHYK